MYRILRKEHVLDVLSLSIKISNNINEPIEYVFRSLYDGISRKSLMHFDNLGIPKSCFPNAFFEEIRIVDLLVDSNFDADIKDIEQAITSVKQFIYV